MNRIPVGGATNEYLSGLDLQEIYGGTMTKEKPPVLSDKELGKRIPKGFHYLLEYKEEIACFLQAQRDDTYEKTRQETAQDIGETLCVLAGNLMMENKEAGTLLATQLQPVIDYIKAKYLPHLPRKRFSPCLKRIERRYK